MLVNQNYGCIFIYFLSVFFTDTELYQMSFGNPGLLILFFIQIACLVRVIFDLCYLIFKINPHA